MYDERFVGFGDSGAHLDLPETGQGDPASLGDRPRGDDEREFNPFVGYGLEWVRESALPAPRDPPDASPGGPSPSVEAKDPVSGGLPAVVAEERCREQAGRRVVPLVRGRLLLRFLRHSFDSPARFGVSARRFGQNDLGS
jgi:hypothetical protein